MDIATVSDTRIGANPTETTATPQSIVSDASSTISSAAVTAVIKDPSTTLQTIQKAVIVTPKSLGVVVETLSFCVQCTPFFSYLLPSEQKRVPRSLGRNLLSSNRWKKYYW